MDNSVVTLSNRVQSLRTEIEIQNRKRTEEAEKAIRGLKSISAEDVEMLKTIVPGLGVIVTYSVEDIQNNTDGAIENIHRVMDELRSYIEQRLTYYEGQL